MDVTDNSISPVPLAGSSLNTPSEHVAELVLDRVVVTQPPSLTVEENTLQGQGLPPGNGSSMDGSPKQLNRTFVAGVSETYVCPCDVSIHIHVPCTICIYI